MKSQGLFEKRQKLKQSGLEWFFRHGVLPVGILRKRKNTSFSTEPYLRWGMEYFCIPEGRKRENYMKHEKET